MNLSIVHRSWPFGIWSPCTDGHSHCTAEYMEMESDEYDEHIIGQRGRIVGEWMVEQIQGLVVRNPGLCLDWTRS